jgi:hypothetical protein
MHTGARRHWVGLVAALVMASGALAACSDDGTSVVVVFRVEDEALRPEYILFGWRTPDGRLVDDLRLPASGVLPTAGSRLGSVQMDLLEDRPGVREVVARGMRGELAVSAAQGQIPWRPGERTTVTLTLDCLPPAALDHAGPGCATPTPANDAGVPDGVGAQAGSADAAGGSAPPEEDATTATDQAAEAESGPRRDAAVPDVPADVVPPADSGPPDARPEGPPPNIDLSGGLVLYFTMDERPGSGTAADSSGYRNLGTLANLDVSRAWVPGRFGQALELPGAPLPGWLSVPSSDSLNRVSIDVSVSLWVRANPAGEGRATLIARRSPGTGGFLYSVHLEGDRPAFWLNSSHGARAAATSTQGLPRDRWVHLALVHDLRRLRAQLYMDGELAAQAVSPLALPPENSPLVIGGSQGASPGSVIDAFAGRLDEVALYDRPLTRAEVQALAAGFRP